MLKLLSILVVNVCVVVDGVVVITVVVETVDEVVKSVVQFTPV